MKKKNEGLDKVSSLMEEVRDLVSSLTPNPRLEAMEAFANIALISENLAKGLASIAEQLEDEKLGKVAVSFEDLAREAAQVALTLESADDAQIDASALKEEFDDQAGYMLDGLDLFSDLTEDEDDKDDDKDKDEDDDKDEKKDDEKKDKEEQVDWGAIAAALSEKADAISRALNPGSPSLGGTDLKTSKAPWLKAKPEKSMGIPKDHPANGPDLSTAKGGTQKLERD